MTILLVMWIKVAPHDNQIGTTWQNSLACGAIFYVKHCHWMANCSIFIMWNNLALVHIYVMVITKLPRIVICLAATCLLTSLIFTNIIIFLSSFPVIFWLFLSTYEKNQLNSDSRWMTLCTNSRWFWKFQAGFEILDICVISGIQFWKGIPSSHNQPGLPRPHLRVRYDVTGTYTREDFLAASREWESARGMF